jgi:type IV pilus assembly protein PilM
VRVPTWLAPVPPTIAIELASRRVTVVEVPNGAPVVTAYAAEPLPDGVLVPSLTGPNIMDPRAVVEALGRALDRAGLSSARRAALVVPDSVARVSLLSLDQVPAKAQELDQVVRWQVRKSTPFPLEEAQITHFPASKVPGSLSVAAVVARRDVISRYEAVLAALGIHAGVVDLSSLSVMNAAMAGGVSVTGDWLLVHIAAEATTLAILRGNSLLFYRHRAAVDEESLGSLVHQTAMYHEDRLGGGAFARVWLSGAGPGVDEARWQINSRLGVPVEPIDIRPAAEIRNAQETTSEVIDALVPTIGVLVRERQVA